MSRRDLMPYQRRWVQDVSPISMWEKSRRIGASWSEAYGSVMHAGEGTGDVYYQSYALDMARGFINDAADWAEVLQLGADAVDETLIELDDKTSIQAFRMNMASGKGIVALTANPRAWRSKGRPGDVAIIDEAAFVDNLAEVLKAAMGTTIWGGRVRVISTHNGESSPFNLLLRDVREGVQPGTVHRVTFRDAINEGLYRRICAVSGREWSPEAEVEWEAAIRAMYSNGGSEELDCIPSAGGGAWLAWDLIRAAEHAKAGDPQKYSGGRTYIGVDIARRRDLWVAVVVEVVGDVLWVREMRVERNIPFSEQHAIVDGLVERYRPVRVAIDQTGMGEEFVEIEQRKHGERRVEGVLLTAPNRLDVATALRQQMEDRKLRIPGGDVKLRNDLYAVKSETGPTGSPRLIADDAGTDGHADRFWATALAVAAGSGPAVKIEGLTLPHREAHGAFADPSTRVDALESIDHDLGIVYGDARELGGFH